MIELMDSGIQTMDAWVETFGTVVDGKKMLTTANQSLVVSILSAGVSRTVPRPVLTRRPFSALWPPDPSPTVWDDDTA